MGSERGLVGCMVLEGLVGRVLVAMSITIGVLGVVRGGVWFVRHRFVLYTPRGIFFHSW